ncbi:biosynthetic-type acetolactate synthase large subunit [Streptomyces sp. NPDC050085]|uniref:biosynthetic-type acetolactate synthase large subunit n=1 Tax=Streptomyces sp. NPDC050085 TaxID=3365600 RepID=UPI0037AD66E4
MPAEPLTGAESLVRVLEELGVRHVWGIPGGAVLPLYDALGQSSLIRHVLVRHEQGAGHAAEGYALVSGKPGVCIATSGPGATNLLTALTDAYVDSVPLVAITAQVDSTVLGTSAFQEADICAMAAPVTRTSSQITRADDIAPVLGEAFRTAVSGRPGPVLVDVTKDALQGSIADPRTTPQPSVPTTRPAPDAQTIETAVTMMGEARRPVLYIGGGVLRAGASQELRALVEATNIPVVTTLAARGAFPDSHPLHLGMPGMHGTIAAVGALQHADLLVAVGSRFDDRVTGRTDTFAPEARVVHADIDATEFNKIRRADLAVLGDARHVLADLHKAWIRCGADPAYTPWLDRLRQWQRAYPLGYEPSHGDVIAPQEVVEAIGRAGGALARIATGVGQHQMWAAQFIGYERPGSFLSSCGLGTMGYGLPAAMGAQVADPDSTVWVIDGDGSFQMTCQELATCAVEGIPVKVAVINNGGLGMVRQWQDLFYEGRRAHTTLPRQVPDFAELARSFGCVGLRCTRAEDIDPIVARAQAVTDAPVVVDFHVRSDATLWPMVMPRSSNSAIQFAQNMSPTWGDDS